MWRAGQSVALENLEATYARSKLVHQLYLHVDRWAGLPSHIDAVSLKL